MTSEAKTFYCEQCQRELPKEVPVLKGKPGQLYHLRSVRVPFGRMSVECGPVRVKEAVRGKEALA